MDVDECVELAIKIKEMIADDLTDRMGVGVFTALREGVWQPAENAWVSMIFNEMSLAGLVTKESQDAQD